MNRDLVLTTKFLSAIGRSDDIRAALAKAAGYSEEDHQLGWDLLHRTMGYRAKAERAREPLAQAQALAELDAWDGPAFERTRAAWRVAYASQSEYVFADLTAQEGGAVIGSVQAFVDRVVALREGTDPSRAATREADREAVHRLGLRRIFDRAIEAHLRQLLAQATHLAAAPEQRASSEADFERATLELHDWLIDWRGQARAVITRGDYLIRLGLAPRRPTATQAQRKEPRAPVRGASIGSGVPTSPVFASRDA